MSAQQAESLRSASTAANWALADFTGVGYDKGRSWVVQAIWFVTLNVFFTAWWFPVRWRPAVLRMFGARVGNRVLIRHRVRVLWPWKLEIGSNCWVGEEAWLLNLEPIRIGSDVCISQGAFLCTGSHDRRSPSFEFDNAPIWVEDNTWIATQALILRGVTIRRGTVVGARAIVTKDLRENTQVPAGATW